MVIIIIVAMNESNFGLDTKLNKQMKHCDDYMQLTKGARSPSAGLPIVAVCFGLDPDEWMKLCCRFPTVSEKHKR